MRTMYSNRGNPILIDDEDWARCMLYSWCEFPGKGKTYLHSVVNGKHVLLHRFILEPSEDQLVDHRSGDTFDNRKENLRIASIVENARNRVVNRHSTTGLKGVSPAGGRFRARIRYEDKRIDLGCFATPEEAHTAYVEASQKYHGEFARV